MAALGRARLEPAVVSTGGTPDLFRAHEVGTATEHRPGTYVFRDRDQIRAGGILDDCAMRVLATVVSRPTDGRAILDAGSKTLSSDKLGLDGYGLVLVYPQLVLEMSARSTATSTAPPATQGPGSASASPSSPTTPAW